MMVMGSGVATHKVWQTLCYGRLKIDWMGVGRARKVWS